jgi:hypothetical protein
MCLKVKYRINQANETSIKEELNLLETAHSSEHAAEKDGELRIRIF